VWCRFRIHREEVQTVKLVSRLSDIIERLAQRGVSEEDVFVDSDSIRIVQDDSDDGEDEDDD
jgi:hypothetical protein